MTKKKATRKQHDYGREVIPEEVELGNTEELMLTGDVMSAHDLINFPRLKGETPRNQGVMAAYSLGYGQRFIAKMFGIEQPAVSKIIKKIDPEHTFRISADAKKAFLTRIAESRAVEAISLITYEDLVDSSATEKARVADTMLKITQSLNQSKHKELGASMLDNLIDGAIKEAEVIVVEKGPLEEG
jgi:predicted transcriptional regulator